MSTEDQLTRIESMTNVELRAELKRHGCSTSGVKKDLLAKLRLALVKHHSEEKPADLPSQSHEVSIDSVAVDPVSQPDPGRNDPEPTPIEIPPVEVIEEKKPPIANNVDPTPSPPVVAKATLVKGFGRSTNHRLNLSSDILKTLIPNITLAPEPSRNDFSILETTVDNDLLGSDSITIGDLVDQKPQRSRRVVMDVVTSPNKPAAYPPKTNALTMDDLVRIKDASVARESPSRILYISGLTRPFTLQQLRELLRRFGSFDDDQCWLDKIKSQSLIAYQTVDEAQKARQAIDGCRWPSTNPKTLVVRFARQEEFDFSRTRDLPPDQMTLDAVDRLTQKKSTHSSEKRKPPQQNREAETPTEVNSGFLILEEEEEPVPTENSAIKGLDDYFRKTETKPVIYWLPLTEEQVVERVQRKRDRRSPSPREKRPRRDSSVSRHGIEFARCK